MSYDEYVTKLLAQIAQAFASTKYPGDDYLVPCTWGSDVESARGLAADLKGRGWREVLLYPNEWFRRNHDAFVLMTPQAYAYYLPAFLSKILTDYRDLDLVPDWLVCSLEPPSDAALRSSHSARIQALNQHQRACLLAVLGFLKRQTTPASPEAQQIERARRELKKFDGSRRSSGGSKTA